VTGEPGDHVVALKGFLASRNIELSYANAEVGAAYGASLKGRILLRDDVSPAVEFSVLVHEIAHLCTRSRYVTKKAGNPIFHCCRGGAHRT
jgi:hypothetical protein